MIPPDLVGKFQKTLPRVREWVQTTLRAHQGQAVPLAPKDHPRLARVFPADVLNRVRCVVVSGNPPFPPLSRMGLPEFARFETMAISGVTYNDTFFVRKGQPSESLYFHEMVHVVQWDRLGVDRFLLAYGAGLMQAGYRDSPLEETAYRLQAAFDRDALPGNLMARIHQETDALWKAAASQLDLA